MSDKPVNQRRRLSAVRQSLTHKFTVGGEKGYLHVGLYDDGTPGEIFVKMAKEGSTVSGLMDALSVAVSVGLQHGVPLSLLVDKFTRMHFEPYGATKNPQIPRASSVLDYLFRWLGNKFCKIDDEAKSEGELGSR